MKTKIALLVITVLILLTATLNVKAASASTTIQQVTEVRIINPKTGNGAFTFSSDTTPIGTRFNATVWVYDVTNLFGFQVNLIVNDTLLNITRTWLPMTDPNYVFYGQMQMPLGPSFYDNDGDGVNERVLVGATELAGAVTFTGNGFLAIIELEITYTPPAGTVSCLLNIDNADTKLLNAGLGEISATKIDGNYKYVGPAAPEPPHAEFTFSPLEPFAGRPVTFDASASIPNGGTIISYIWNFGDGTPEIVETGPVTTHVFTSNGTFNVTLTVIDSEGLNDTTWQLITVQFVEINVDLNGDGKVDILDIAPVGLAFGSYPGNERWNELADVNKDGVVDIFDLVLVAMNFGLTL
jgi:PKD repeat protein